MVTYRKSAAIAHGDAKGSAEAAVRAGYFSNGVLILAALSVIGIGQQAFSDFDLKPYIGFQPPHIIGQDYLLPTLSIPAFLILFSVVFRKNVVGGLLAERDHNNKIASDFDKIADERGEPKSS